MGAHTGEVARLTHKPPAKYSESLGMAFSWRLGTDEVDAIANVTDKVLRCH
jgi:hypothetical protein